MVASVVCLAILENGQRKKLTLQSGLQDELIAELSSITSITDSTLLQIYDDELEDFVDLEPGTPVHNKAKIKLARKLVRQADEGENKESAQVNGGSPEKENEAEVGEDGPGKNIQAVTDVIKAAKVEQPLQQLKRQKQGSPPNDTIEKDLDCPVCGKQFTKKYYLQCHLQTTVCSGKPPPSHPCEVCGKVYSRKEVENEESAQVNGGSPEKENEAEVGEDGTGKNIHAVTDVIKAAKAEQRLQQLKHRKQGSPPDDTIEKDLDCPVCGKQFTKKYYLQRHLQMTACSGKPPPSHLCELCGKVYSRKDNLREHLRAHAGEVTRRKKYMCDHCGKTFHGISLLKIHIRVHTGERPFPCDFCNKGFPSVTALNKHRRIHTGEKPYACAECGMQFSLKGTLNRHMRVHTGIRPHKCPYCGKEFIQAGGLKAHLFYHTGMNGFKCTVCDKVFNRKARLDLHMKYLHLKEKPHVCEDCGKGFTRREDLNRHSVLHTGEKPFQCPTCHKRFAIKPSLKIHMVTHTKEEPRSCHECGRAFSRKDCVMRHMHKRHHDLLDRILLDEEDDRFAPTPVATPGGTANTNSGIKLGPQAGTVARILSEQALCESICELLGLLVDEPTLKGFGYPDKPVDELLEAVIRRCGHSPASPDDYNYMDRLRENSKLLFTVVINDNAVKTLLNNQTVDEVILHVLRLAKS
ncbi:oocyte zinc finger protein XlCOF6-like isoform X2 [Dermacentor albipictus]|uniref:oocyte zinc finger protein XlCOF6-like isoform X2 n=1 Tax=Dermacentor albipictus TaxID=60249 RepID=UPI0038FBEED9